MLFLDGNKTFASPLFDVFIESNFVLSWSCLVFLSISLNHVNESRTRFGHYALFQELGQTTRVNGGCRHCCTCLEVGVERLPAACQGLYNASRQVACGDCARHSQAIRCAVITRHGETLSSDVYTCSFSCAAEDRWSVYAVAVRMFWVLFQKRSVVDGMGVCISRQI